MSASEARREIIAACRNAWKKGLLAGFNGNVSLRCGKECLITCAGAAKGYLQADEIVAASLSDGSCAAARRPSTELSLHLALYRARSDAAAIVHAHPAHLLALSLRTAEEDFLRLPLFEAEALRAGLAFVPALPPGSEELACAASLAAAPNEIHALWLLRHGLVCLGGTLTQALALAEEMEHLARTQLLR